MEMTQLFQQKAVISIKNKKQKTKPPASKLKIKMLGEIPDLLYNKKLLLNQYDSLSMMRKICNTPLCNVLTGVFS